MEKVLSILIVFGMLLLIIVRSIRKRDRKFREYRLIRKILPPMPVDGPWRDGSAAVGGLEGVIDREHNLSFVLIGDLMQVLDERTGQPVADIKLDLAAEWLVFDEGARLLFCLHPQGAVTVIRQDSPEQYRVLQLFGVPDNADGMVLDPLSGELYVRAGNTLFVYGAW